MTTEEILRMAQEAGAYPAANTDRALLLMSESHLERFAALVAAAERNRTWTQDHWTEYERSIAAAEREACALTCEQAGMEGMGTLAAAAAIRARGQA